MTSQSIAGLSSLLKDGTRHLTGVEEAVLRNIEACKELAKVVRTSLGPNGMNKIVVNQNDRLFVTNDAATIIRELDVIHPAARMVVMASKQQEQEIGDYTNFVVVFAGELLEQAELLLRQGLHLSEVVAGYTKAGDKALEFLEKLVVENIQDIKDVTKIARYLRSVVSSKQYGWEDTLTPLIAQACVSVLPKNASNFNVDNIRVCKVIGGGVSDAYIIRGFAIPTDSLGTVRHVTKARVAVFASGIETGRTETRGSVLFTSADQLANWTKGEEEMVEQIIKDIAATGVNVVVSGGNVSELALHFLELHKIMVVKEGSKYNIRRICKAINAIPLVRLGAPTPEEIGNCDSVSVEEIGSTRVCFFRNESEDCGISTLLLRGSTENVLDDIERCIEDSVNAYKVLIRDARLLAGAGASEFELSRLLAAYGEEQPGLDQYAIKKFAEALQVIPRTLAENAGLSPTETVSELWTAHQAGNHNHGINIEEGGLRNSAEAGINDSYLGKWWAIKFATHAVLTILKIDQIIMAKPSGGPKVKQLAARDED